MVSLSSFLEESLPHCGHCQLKLKRISEANILQNEKNILDYIFGFEKC